MGDKKEMPSGEKIDVEGVRKVAKLAKLELPADEEKELAQDLQKILGFFNEMSSLPTDHLNPLVHPSPSNFQPREDRAENFSGAPEELLEGAPDRQGNLYKVPPAIT